MNENYPILISFLRKFNMKQKLEEGLFEYKTLSNFKKDKNTYNFAVKKLMAKIDKDKENQFVDKSESIFNNIYIIKI